MRTARAAVLLVALFLGAFPAASSAAKPIGKRIVLENGMVILLAERHDVPLVTVNVTLRAGALAEPADEPGLAAITASLLTQGTESRTAEQISDAIDFIGGSLTTSAGKDFASADLRVLAKDLRPGLDLLADVLRHPAFAQAEIDRAVRKRLAAIKQQKEEPDAVAKDAFDHAVFGDHPYGRTNDEVAAFLPHLTRDDVERFYRERYGPDTAVVAVVGDVTEQEITDLLQERFASWKKSVHPLQPAPALPKIGKTTIVKIDKDVVQATIILGNLGISREDPDYYSCLVMNYILGGGGFSSRLMDDIRDNRGLAYDVHSTFDARKEPGAFSVFIQTKNASANQVISETLKDIRRMRDALVTRKELADAKAYLTGSFPLRMDTSGKIAGILTGIELFHLGLDYPERYARIINAVTREDVRRAARNYLHPDRMVIVTVADQEKAKIRDE